MSDILSSIDEAIDATTGRCAKCGGRLPADCPSEDWCSQDCQRAWTAAYGDPLLGYGADDMSGQATAMRWAPEVESEDYRVQQAARTYRYCQEYAVFPQRWLAGVPAEEATGEGYFAPAGTPPDDENAWTEIGYVTDAESTYSFRNATRLWLNGLRQAEDVRYLSRRPDPEPLDTQGQPAQGGGWHMATSGPVRFRRWCERCRAFSGPVAGIRSRPWSFDETAEPDAAEVRRCDSCTTCRSPWPGPSLVAQWRPTTGGYDLRLAGGDATSRAVLPRDYALAMPEVVDHNWGQMVAHVLDMLTYRSPCMVANCAEKARAFFAVHTPIEFQNRRWPVGNLDLCWRHEGELWSTTRYPYPVPLDLMVRP